MAERLKLICYIHRQSQFVRHLSMSKYILEDKQISELERLGFQDEVWANETGKLFDKAVLKKAQRVLEIGCGPGYSIRELINGEAKEIWGIDSSEFFIHHLKKWITHQKLGNRIVPLCEDINQADLPENYFDACYCRWVLMFLPNIEEVIHKIYQSLKPNGVFAMMEYGPFRDISIHPPSVIFDKIYEAVFKLIEKAGGDPDIGLKLPELLKNAGFKKIEKTAVSKSGGPGSNFWKWIEITGKNHDNLVENNLIQPKDLQSYYELMKERSRDETSLFTAPTMQQIIAYK